MFKSNDIIMFGSSKESSKKVLNHSGRSYVGESLHIEGDLRSSGSIDIAGLVNGNVYVDDMSIAESGSVRGNLEVRKLEINGHVEGRIAAETIILGKNAVVKGDIFFRNTLKTEEGADIDGYIKRINNGKLNSEEDIAIEEIVDRSESIKKPSTFSESILCKNSLSGSSFKKL